MVNKLFDPCTHFLGGEAGQWQGRLYDDTVSNTEQKIVKQHPVSLFDSKDCKGSVICAPQRDLCKTTYGDRDGQLLTGKSAASTLPRAPQPASVMCFSGQQASLRPLHTPGQEESGD